MLVLFKELPVNDTEVETVQRVHETNVNATVSSPSVNQNVRHSQTSAGRMERLGVKTF